MLLALGGAPWVLGCSLIGVDGLTGGYAGDDAGVEGGDALVGRSEVTDASSDAIAPLFDAAGADATGPGNGGGPEPGPLDARAPDTGALDAGLADGGGPAEAGAPGEVTVDLIPTRDAYVMDGSDADTNYGTGAVLIVKSSPSAGFSRNTWVGFDTSGYATITAATLRLYVNSVQTTASNTVPLFLYYPPASSQSWSETSITWNNAPQAGTNLLGTVDVNDPQDKTWIEYDVTAAVAAETSGTPSFLVTSTVSANREVMLSSREGSFPPVLRITGTLP